MFVYVCCTAHLFPVEVKKKGAVDFEAFQKGKFSGVSLDSKGTLFLGPKIKAITGPGREYYLGLAAAENGDIYVGTGHQGSVFKVGLPAATPASSASTGAGAKKSAADSTSTAAAADEDTVKEICRFDELDVYALLVKSNGDIFAGTSPDGKLYKIDKNQAKGNENEKGKNVKEFFNPDEKYIWDIKEDKAGNIILATGNAGGIYRVNKDGVGDKIFTSEDTHIISLYIAKADVILAGSGDQGILYQVDNTKARVLFDSPFEEIRGICQDKDGNIFFSATRDIKKQNILDNAEVEAFLEKKKKKEQEEEEIPLEKSVLYCLRPDGVTETVWSSRTEYIYSVCYDQKENSVLIGAGNSGRVYRVQKDGSYTIIYESESAQVFKIEAMNRGFTIITNNSAGVAGIEDAVNSRGDYFSEIYDLGIQSKLGKIYWDAEIPAGTGVSLTIRTGNSNVPDAAWSKWSAPFTDSENSSIDAPGVRYFQVKAALNTTNPSSSPRLNNYRVYYVQANLRPQLKKIVIKKPVKPFASFSASPVMSMSAAAAAGGAGANPQEPATHYLTLQWEAGDPNKDKLKYNLYLKKTSDANWLLFKEDIAAARAILDTRLYEDGEYRLKVIADDSLANPPDMTETASLVSSPFLVDSTAPEMVNFSFQPGPHRRAVFTVADKTSLVAGVFYSYDGELWFPVFPVDLIADSKSENYNFTLKDMDAGKNKYIFIKVSDEFNNSKVYQKEL
ncbi:MAG: fibronectin type III domain-containing protein [Candidatus Aminicenantes bacterium]|nr:fibronectin type III domain-containing protein [Candidatus Aminicenantes bacterium]